MSSGSWLCPWSSLCFHVPWVGTRAGLSCSDQPLASSCCLQRLRQWSHRSIPLWSSYHWSHQWPLLDSDTVPKKWMTPSLASKICVANKLLGFLLLFVSSINPHYQVLSFLPPKQFSKYVSLQHHNLSLELLQSLPALDLVHYKSEKYF